MKKIICYIFIFLLSSTFLFSVGTGQNSKRIAGKIILNKANDLREFPNYDEKKLFKKAGYFTKQYLIGGDLKLNGEIQSPLITDEPIDKAITEKVYEALSFCNFEVFKKSLKNNKLPTLDIDINILFSKMEYSHMKVGPVSSNEISCVLQSEIKIYLKSSNNKILLEKIFYYDDYNKDYSFTYSNYVISFLSDVLYDQLIVFFQSETFLEAYNGRKKIFKEYMVKYNPFGSVGDRFKDLEGLHKEVPNSLSEDISCIYLSGNYIKDLSPLNNYKELYELVLSNSFFLSEISKLNNLKNLEYLNLDRCQFLNNIDNLKTLENLTYLTLDNNYKIKNYKSINFLKKLKYISLRSNLIRKIENFSNLTNLIKINLSRNKISKIESIDNLENLISLNLSSNDIGKIQNLDKLSNLSELNLAGNEIRKIENIEKLSNLKTLYLGGNSISKIENLNKLVDLEVLYLGGTKIKKIENLEDLVNLKELNLWYCKQIKKIENIDNLLELKVLKLSGTSIKEIENINNLINLEELYLSDTKIKELKNIENLKNLKVLDISKTKINNLRVLENFPNLEILDITESKIIRLENLEKCLKLIRIKAKDIQIDEITKATYEFLKQRDWKFYENLTLDEWIKKYFIKIVE
jgi:Leucine-rich repeat (LRR) protein